jgi:hypothetical protein
MIYTLTVFIVAGLAWVVTGVDPLIWIIRGLIWLRAGLVVVGELAPEAAAEWWARVPKRAGEAWREVLAHDPR